MTSFVQNNEDTYINNISWKGGNNRATISISKGPINARPFINTASSPGLNAPLRTGQGRLIANPFRANPIKHYRKQYSNVTPLAMGGPTTPIKSIDRALLPGGLQSIKQLPDELFELIDNLINNNNRTLPGTERAPVLEISPISPGADSTTPPLAPKAFDLGAEAGDAGGGSNPPTTFCPTNTNICCCAPNNCDNVVTGFNCTGVERSRATVELEVSDVTSDTCALQYNVRMGVTPADGGPPGNEVLTFCYAPGSESSPNRSNCVSSCLSDAYIQDPLTVLRPGDNPLNKVGDHYPRAAFAGDETYAVEGGYANNNPCNNLPGNYKQCVAVCDPAKAARARVRYPSTVNTNKLKPKYYQSNSAYLRARARTFNQKAMTHVDQAANTCVPRDTKPGAVTANCLQFYPNAVETCAATPDCGGCRQVSTFYKPSNSTFAHQGAVASGTRVERLKHDTIQKFANSFVKDRATNIGLSGAYSFRGAGAAPYTMKSKTNRCDPTTYHRNGNPVVCRPFPPAKKFFNQHNNPAY
jgi:hypothetical protein